MNHSHHATRTVAAALLSGGVALAGLGLATATAYAGPANGVPIPAFNPQPEPPGRPGAATNSQPESPGVRVGFNPQPDPPGRPTTKVIIAISQ